MAVSFYRLTAEAVTPDEKEVSRYLGYSLSSPPDAVTADLIHSSTTEMHRIIKPQAVYDTFELRQPQQDVLNFSSVIQIKSRDLACNMEGCSRAVLFAATIGAQADALIRRMQVLNSVKAAVMQSCGAMFIESFCDSLNKMITAQAASEGSTTKPRFSPGYGDVPLSVQKQFFTVLPCIKIGLTLTDALIMAPEKSVTAFIGITGDACS